MGSRRHVDSRRSLVSKSTKDCGMPPRHRARRRPLRRHPAAARGPSSTNGPCDHRLDGTTQRRAFAGLEAGGCHQAPGAVLVASSVRPRGIVDLDLGGRLAERLHAEHRRVGLVTATIIEPTHTPVGRGTQERRAGGPARTRRRRRRDVPPRAHASTRPRRAPSRAGRAARPGTPRRRPVARRRRVARWPAATRSSRSRARWTRIGTPDCAASPASSGDGLERHLPRLRHEHRGGTRLHGERRGIPPRGRAVDDDDRPGHAIDALRALRKAGDGDDVVGELGDDRDAGVHDGAPAWIAAAAASARSIAKIASSRTSWYSMVAVPSRSAASARHSRT